MENIEKVIDKFLKDIFPDDLKSSENELFVAFALFYYMTGYTEKGKKSSYGFLNLNKKRDVINFNWITPKGRTFRMTYTSLYHIFEQLEINNVRVIFHREIYEQYKNFGERNEYDFLKTPFKEFYNGEDEYLLFNAPMFLFFESDILENCEIVNDFNTEENIKKLHDFIEESVTLYVGGGFEKVYNTVPFNRQKELFLDKLAKLHNFYGNVFNLKEKEFWIEGEDRKFLNIHFIIFLWLFEYIKIFTFTPVEDFPLLDKSGKYIAENEKYTFQIMMTEKLVNLVEGWIEVKSIILDKIFSEEYNQLTIKKQKGRLHLMEGDIELYGKDIRFADLKKKYPYSDIQTKVHKGKSTKYLIKEKIRLDKKLKEL